MVWQNVKFLENSKLFIETMNFNQQEEFTPLRGISESRNDSSRDRGKHMAMSRHVPGSIRTILGLDNQARVKNVHMSSRQNRSAFRTGGLGSIDSASISVSVLVSSHAQLILQSVCEKLCHSRSTEMRFRFSGDKLFRLVRNPHYNAIEGIKYLPCL